MALVSPPIAVGVDTPLNCELTLRKLSVNVQFRYYSDAAGETEVVPRGGGARTITATNTTASGFEGDYRAPTRLLPTFVSEIDNGTLAAATSETWYELGLGSGLGQLTIVATGLGTDAPGAVTYRIVVDADGKSSI